MAASFFCFRPLPPFPFFCGLVHTNVHTRCAPVLAPQAGLLLAGVGSPILERISRACFKPRFTLSMRVVVRPREHMGVSEGGLWGGISDCFFESLFHRHLQIRSPTDLPCTFLQKRTGELIWELTFFFEKGEHTAPAECLAFGAYAKYKQGAPPQRNNPNDKGKGGQNFPLHIFRNKNTLETRISTKTKGKGDKGGSEVEKSTGFSENKNTTSAPPPGWSTQTGKTSTNWRQEKKKRNHKTIKPKAK